MRKVSGNQNGHQSHGAGNGKSSKTKATIMSELKTWGASIRKLAPMEVFKFRDHLLRLDRDSRRLRFAHGVSDSFIEKYASGMNDDGSIVFGYFEGNEVREFPVDPSLAAGGRGIHAQPLRSRGLQSDESIPMQQLNTRAPGRKDTEATHNWVLTLNAGSSSLKFALFDQAGQDVKPFAMGQIEGIGLEP